jgi:hypothetical protein
MRSRILSALFAALSLGGLVLLAGCGADTSSLKVEEGEPVSLNGLSYNVSISRLLNPADPEDSAYLQGQKPLPDTKQWFGVFMQVHNSSGTPQQIPTDLVIRDTQGDEFHPVSSTSDFALQLGSTIQPGDQLPDPESPAANGPIQGAMVLFLIDQAAFENRPLTLEIPGPNGETGEVELDV